MDPDAGFDGVSFLADKGYPYPDLINNSIMLELGSDWQFDIALERTLSFRSLKKLPLPCCLEGSDNENEENVPKFNYSAVNKNYALWARAGERMVPGSGQWPFND